MEKSAKIEIFKDLILTQEEFGQIYNVENNSFPTKYFVPLIGFIESKLNFQVTSNKKENHPQSITYQLKCLKCKKIASATVKRYKLVEENINFTFKSSCDHYKGMYLPYLCELFFIFIFSTNACG